MPADSITQLTQTLVMSNTLPHINKVVTNVVTELNSLYTTLSAYTDTNTIIPPELFGKLSEMDVLFDSVLRKKFYIDANIPFLD